MEEDEEEAMWAREEDLLLEDEWPHPGSAGTDPGAQAAGLEGGAAPGLEDGSQAGHWPGHGSGQMGHLAAWNQALGTYGGGYGNVGEEEEEEEEVNEEDEEEEGFYEEGLGGVGRGPGEENLGGAEGAGGVKEDGEDEEGEAGEGDDLEAQDDDDELDEGDDELDEGDDELDEEEVLDEGPMLEHWDQDSTFTDAYLGQHQQGGGQLRQPSGPAHALDEYLGGTPQAYQLGHAPSANQDTASRGPQDIGREASGASALPKDGRKRGMGAEHHFLFGASMEEIWAAAEPPKRQRRRKEMKKRGRKKGALGPPPAVARKLGDANMLYASGKFEEAIPVLEGIIKSAPNVADSYHTLGLVYDALGDQRRAANLFTIAAHLTPKDTELWKRVAQLSMAMGNVSQALYCLAKVVRRDPHDLEARWDRAVLLADAGRFEAALAALEPLRESRASDANYCCMLAKMYYKTGHPEKAVAVLESLVQGHAQGVSPTAVNILAELYLAQGRHEQALSLINSMGLPYPGLAPGMHTVGPTSGAGPAGPVQRGAQKLPAEGASADGADGEGQGVRAGKKGGKGRGGGEGSGEEEESEEESEEEGRAPPGMGDLQQLPIDLVVKAGVCLLHLGKPALAQECFHSLLAMDVSDCRDLLALAGDAYLDVKMPAEAIPLFARLLPADSLEPSAAAQSEHPGQAAEGQAGDRLDEAKDAMEGDAEASLAALPRLARALDAVGRSEDAVAVLEQACHRCTGPPPAEVLLQLADLFVKLGRTSDAEAVLTGTHPSVGTSPRAVGPTGSQGEPDGGGYPTEGPRSVELTLRHAALLREHGSPEEFVAFALPAVRSSLLADAENAALVRRFRSAYPTWRPWMGRLRRALQAEHQRRTEEEEHEGQGGGAGDTLYRGLTFRLPRGLQFNLHRRRKLVQMAMEAPSAAQLLQSEQGQRAQDFFGASGRFFLESLANSQRKGVLPPGSAARPRGPGAERVALAQHTSKRAKGTAALEAELEALQIPNVDEPTLLQPALPELFSDARQHSLLLQVCTALLALGRAKEAEQVVELALDVGKARRMSKEQRKELRAIIADEASGILQFDVAQQLILEQPYGLRGWEIFHRLTLRGMERNDRRAKFLQSMRARYPDCVPALVISGHHHAAGGLLQGAAKEYLKAFRLHPHDPLIALCGGVSFLNLAMGSRLRNRSNCVLQAFAFLHRYAELRGQCQETFFNLGRAYHQVGLLHLAVEHYEKALAVRPQQSRGIPKAAQGSGESDEELGRALQPPGPKDLRREAAFNLVLIYKNSGAESLARHVMESYLVV